MDQGASILHPQCGTGHKHHSMYLSLQTSCGEALSKVIGKVFELSVCVTHSALALLTANCNMCPTPAEISADVKDESKKESAMDLDQLFSIAGLHTKEKRDKTKAPPRPVSRRGHRTEMAARALSPSPLDFSCSHALFPGQTLPKELTLSQLIGLQQHRGVDPGQAKLTLNISLLVGRKQKGSVDSAIPEGKMAIIRFS
jgi:baculoviral IAP repeat-containing protein 6